jgi:hypothetical protein
MYVCMYVCLRITLRGVHLNLQTVPTLIPHPAQDTHKYTVIDEINYNLHTHTYIHAYIHTYIHVYIPTETPDPPMTAQDAPAVNEF